MSAFLFWLLWHVPLGPLAPYVLALAMGSKAVRVRHGGATNNKVKDDGSDQPD